MRQRQERLPVLFLFREVVLECATDGLDEDEAEEEKADDRVVVVQLWEAMDVSQGVIKIFRSGFSVPVQRKRTYLLRRVRHPDPKPHRDDEDCIREDLRHVVNAYSVW